ncbi:MAG: exodeoxyribonuclease V subunit gamma [Methyloprofundus sp.]|nr:exodeoxyribonuclease V subunit gamma [Methyloprofundus sp.]
MLILHSSNKTENLLEHLAVILNTAPLSSPFAKEVFLIQSQGMERWLSQQLAMHFQVFANFDFLFPGKFFSQMARRIQQKLSTDVFARELMLWRFELLLRDIEEPVFAPLRQYLSGENTELKRFQLASHLAQVFDQYQMMRPQLLDAWLRGELHYKTKAEKWQQALWLKIAEQTEEQHRGALWLQAIDKFNRLEEGALSTQLPERISVFGLNTMPPLFMEFLQGLARHTDVHFYLLNPAQAFWADIVSKKQADLEQFENGHPLLASLGQQGREFQQMLLERAFTMELDSFEENEGKLSLLEQVQNDLLNNESFAIPLEKDDSLSIHSCHSRLREVEVLKAQLLRALENDADLQLRDMVVMAPNIEQYAPFISAVFEDIQHGIADKSLRSSNATLDAYLSFLRLTQGRFGWQSVMDLLDQKEVYSCFGLNEMDVELIRHWVADVRVRWGKSASHKKELNLPETAENTWQAGLDRLLMGYAVGTDEAFFADVLPYKEIEGNSADALGGLYDFIQLLFKASKELAKTHSLKEWSDCLLAYADLLFPAENMDSEQQAEKRQMNEILLELSDEISELHQQPVSLAVVMAWLEGRVTETKSANGFLRGQLTFCSMLPMRSIPFKVIAILGMNEGEFPHNDHQLTFDLLAKDFQVGDRSRRSDDRYQFLEILLSTRQQLIITYIGQSISENEAIPASIVIQELLDVMQSHYQIHNLVTQHPLQSFSRAYFSQPSDLISYAENDCATAKALLEPVDSNALWWQGQLDLDNNKTIEISDLFAFYRHPQRYFLQKQLQLRLETIEAEEPEREQFSLLGLDSYAIDQEWIEAQLQESDLSLAKLKAQGRWISGELGEVLFNEKQNEIEQFVGKIKAKEAGEPNEPLAIDLEVSGLRLQGALAQQYSEDCLFYRHAAMKGKDFMQAWVQHLIINQVQKKATHLITKDAFISFLPEHIQGGELEQIIKIYQAGKARPDAFFTEAAFAYIKQQAKLKVSARTTKPAIESAKESLTTSVEQVFEPELKLLYENIESLDDFLNTDFEILCNDLLLPAWEAAQIRYLS